MLSTLFVLGCVAFMVPGLCCRLKEYETNDGLCCPMCPEGTIVRRDCTLQSGPRCSPCENGTFMNQPNGLRKCFPCTSCDRGHGLFARQECTVTSDTVCDVLSGYFCKSLGDDTGCSLAEKHTRCTPGQRIKERGTSRNDTVCEACEPGWFSLDGVNCTSWTICSETEVMVKEGSTSSDVVCATASRQHYCYLSVIFFSLVVGFVITGRLISRKDLTCCSVAE